MKNKILLSALLSAGVSFFAAAGVASAADGVVVAPGRLTAQARATLVSNIDKARKASPAAFKAVAQVNDQLAELDAHKRGRFPVVTPMLKALGPEALFAMLERMAVSAPARGELSDAAWTAWRAGLIEAVGMLRDPRSAAVLSAVLDSDEADFFVVRAAAEALGRLGDDASAKKLASMSKVAGPRQKAVLAGMGDCRRTIVAQALADAVTARPDADLAKVVVRSLGAVGSSWAWKTPAVAASGEEGATRALAARALVDAFVAYSGEVRGAASNAILVVDDASTPALIQAAKARVAPSSQLAAELDKLAQRFARNPAR
jgi:hypothetical protein